MNLDYAKARRDWIAAGGKCCVCGTLATFDNSMYWIALKIGVCRKCRFTEEFTRLVHSITSDGSQSDSTR